MHTKLELITNIERAFQAFAPALAERWTYLLNHGEKKWGEISPIDIWPLDDCYRCHPKQTLQELIELPSIQSQMKTSATILACGHAEPRIFEAPLSSVLRVAFRDSTQGGTTTGCGILEGFISIMPDKLLFLANHEGGYAVLEHSKY